MSNLSVFTDFKNGLKNHKQIANGDWLITGKVIYNWQGRTEEETLQIWLRLVGMNAGKIDLDEGTILNSEIVHMEFDSQFKNPVFTLDKNNILKIKGNSSKVGDYEVTIVAL